jgi:hypothetical protein
MEAKGKLGRRRNQSKLRDLYLRFAADALERPRAYE